MRNNHFYQLFKEGKCRYHETRKAATDRGTVHVDFKNETELKIAVAIEGPVSVLIDAGHDNFKMYEEGKQAS